jgi:hypothetical protein
VGQLILDAIHNLHGSCLAASSPMTKRRRRKRLRRSCSEGRRGVCHRRWAGVEVMQSNMTCIALLMGQLLIGGAPLAKSAECPERSISPWCGGTILAMIFVLLLVETPFDFVSFARDGESKCPVCESQGAHLTGRLARRQYECRT